MLLEEIKVPLSQWLQEGLVGAGVLESVAHEKNGSAQQRPLYTCAHTHPFIMFIVLLFIFISLYKPQYGFLLFIRIHKQATLRPYTVFHLVLLLSVNFIPFFLYSSLPLSGSFLPKPIFFSLTSLFDFFALTFLFLPSHLPSCTHLVTSLPVIVQQQHLSP